MVGWEKALPLRARGMGAIVSVTEVEPVRALEASMDGFYVAKLLYVQATPILL